MREELIDLCYALHHRSLTNEEKIYAFFRLFGNFGLILLQYNVETNKFVSTNYKQDNIEYILRGYENFEGKLQGIGGQIERIDSEDEKATLRKSHENPVIQKLYADFLGEPCGHKSHELLHTHYTDRSDSK